MKKHNNSNIDILKILAIVLIISHHFVYDALKINLINHSNYFYNFLYIGGKFGTALFVLITGYFISNKEFDSKKILKLVIKTEVYSYALFAIFTIVFGYKANTIDVIKCLLPISSNRYWFITSYIILYFLTPYINIMTKSIERNMFVKLIVLMTLFMVVLPIVGFNYFVNNTACFIYYYLIGAFICKYEIRLFKRNTVNLLMSIGTYFIIYGSIFLINIASSKFDFLKNKEYYFLRLNSILVVASAVLCFVYFLRLNIKGRKVYSLLSAATLGIYLLHDNFFIKNTLFPFMFSIIYNSNNKYIYSILFIVIVFVLCFIIDTIVSIPINYISNRIKK